MILPFLIAWSATKIYCHQGHVIAYLREENRILKAKLKGKRIPLTDVERRRLAVLAVLVAQQHPDLGSRWLSNFSTRCGLNLGRCQRVSNPVSDYRSGQASCADFYPRAA